MIQVENLTLSFNEKPILEEINLTINQGDFLAIIGPNGVVRVLLSGVFLGFCSLKGVKLPFGESQSLLLNTGIKLAISPREQAKNCSL